MLKKQLNLKHSILLGSTIPVLLTVLVALLVFANLKKLERLSDLNEEGHAIVEYASQLALNTTEMERSARGYMLLKNDASLKHYRDANQVFHQTCDELSKLVQNAAQVTLLQNIHEMTGKIVEATDQQIALVSDGKVDQALALFASGDTAKMSGEVKELIQRFQGHENDMKIGRQKAEDAALHSCISILFFGIMLAVVLALGLGYWIASRTSSRILQVASSTSSVSAELAATICQQEVTANNQAVMVNETTTTLAELGASSRQTAEQAAEATELAKKASIMTENGADAVHEVTLAMGNLKNTIDMIAEQILVLSKETEQIGNISELVKDLSSQINMLALNAAVEAARAGEHGKGFAVVAAEVRKLSVESKKSAEQTKLIVAGIQKATDATIMKTEEGTKDIDTMALLVQRFSQLFEKLSYTAGDVFNSAQQVLLNAKEQASALNQVMDATNSINAGAKETAAGLSQSKIGIQNLNEATVSLQKML